MQQQQKLWNKFPHVPTEMGISLCIN
uniref:Uncharacterized protein n=1 Tax=Arundo donax TaxID=35708 RepID=A0A0A9CAZ6_ARUDO